MSSDLQNELQSLSGANAHIEFIEGIIARHEIDVKTRNTLHDQIALINSRLSDQNLYMAVIGEFSTGKSTFINALLRDKLLEARTEAMTTSSATVIQFGNKLSVELSFRLQPDMGKPSTNRWQKLLLPFTQRGKQASDTLAVKTVFLSEADEPITIAELPNVRNFTIRELIQHCTTSNEVSSRLQRLIINHPASFLAGGVSIIDTPGANAAFELHQQIAREAIAQSDAAIVITPAKQIVSKELIELLLNELYLLPLIHRSVFLVTAMDMIRPRERERLLQSVHQRLKQGLKLEQLPPVFHSSAQSIVDDYSGEEPQVIDEVDRVMWRAHFEKLEGILLIHLKQQRALTIAESILRLVNDLFGELEIHLRELWKEYETQKQALDRAVIPDLQIFAQNQHAECYEKMTPVIDEALLRVDLAVVNHRDELLKHITEQISKANSVDNLKAFIEQSFQKILETHSEQLQKEIDPYFTEMKTAATAANQIFEQRFHEAYQRLELVGRSQIQKQHIAQVSVRSHELIRTASNSTAFAVPTSGDRMTSAIVTGVVAAVLLSNPIGWIAAAVFGSFLPGLFGPTLAQRKEKLLSEIHPQIVLQFDTVRQQVKESVHSYGQELQAGLDEYIDTHVQHYGEIVQTMRAEQRQEAKRLRDIQVLLNDDLRELDQRRNVLETQKEKLRSITYAYSMEV